MIDYRRTGSNRSKIAKNKWAQTQCTLNKSIPTMNTPTSIFHVTLCVVLLASCSLPVKEGSVTDTRSVSLFDDMILLDDYPNYRVWSCHNTTGNKYTVFELGRVTNKKFNTIGFVTFGRAVDSIAANYSRGGLYHQWNWTNESESFRVVLDTEGYARYYDFTSVPIGVSIEPSGVFKCYASLISN